MSEQTPSEQHPAAGTSDDTTVLPVGQAAATADDRGREPEPHGLWAGGRHPVDVGQLVMGVAFLGLVAIWALVASDRVGGDDLRWLAPLPWLLAGGAGLLAVALGGRRRGRTGPG